MQDMPKRQQLEPTDRVLTMFNKTKMKTLGKYVIPLRNPRTHQMQQTEFIVENNHATTSWELRESNNWQLGLVNVQYDKIQTVKEEQPSLSPLSDHDIYIKYHDVFEKDFFFLRPT